MPVRTFEGRSLYSIIFVTVEETPDGPMTSEPPTQVTFIADSPEAAIACLRTKEEPLVVTILGLEHALDGRKLYEA